VATAAVLAAVGPTATSFAGPRDQFTRVGSLSRQPADVVRVLRDELVDVAVSGTIVLVPDNRQIWQIFLTQVPGTTELDTAIAVRDLDTMRLVKVLRVKGKLRRGTSNSGGDWMHAIDGRRRIFFFSQANAVLEFDLKTFAETRHPLPAVAVPGIVPGGMDYDRFDGTLVLLYGGLSASGPTNTNTVVYRYDLRTDTLSAPRSVRSCTGPLPSTDLNGDMAQIPVLIADKSYAYITCTRAGDVGAVVRVSRTGLTDPLSQETMAVGPVSIGTVLADPTSGRLFMATRSGAVYAFDTATMAFVGTTSALAESSLSNRLSYGLDERTGRLFFMSPSHGLGVIEGRYFPVPQARAQRSLRDNAQQRIYIDSRTNRVFVIPDRLAYVPQPAYAIYRVDPAPAPPGAPNPDASTVDRVERPGVTESRFLAGASGYGVRALLANGVNSLAPVPSALGGNPYALLLAKHASSKCGFTDRELLAARVAKTEVDNGSTAVEAIAVEIDSRTKVDLERPSRCDVNIRNGSGNEVFQGIFSTAPGALVAEKIDNAPGAEPRWNRDPAACTSSAGGAPTTVRGNDHGAQPLGESSAVCPDPATTAPVTASATSRLEGAIAVGYAHAQTSIRRDARGVHVDSTAIAGDIVIGSLRIGEVRAVASSVSNGRPNKKPGSSYSVTLRDVVVDGHALCVLCDTEVLVAALNQIGTGRFEVRAASGIDPSLLRGSPRGALTAVQKSAQRQASDQALIGDFTTEVPGFEIIFYNDNAQWGRARQLYQFAGVGTAANYNIVVLPQGDPAGVIDVPGTPTVPDPLNPATQAPDGPPTAAGGDQVAADVPNAASSGLVSAIARGLRLIWIDPREALLVLTAWLLLAQPLLLERRRRRLRAAWSPHTRLRQGAQ
jgi:hypothetical protein